MLCAMKDLCRLIWWALVGMFRSRAALEAENLVLRQQINVLRRAGPKRPAFSRTDRLIFVALCRLFPDVRSALAIVNPDTVIRWHRMGFRAYWGWKSKSRGGTAARAAGGTSIDPRHEPCQSIVGRAADPRRTAQARHRCRADECGQVHGAKEGAAVPGVEDLCAQPC